MKDRYLERLRSYIEWIEANGKDGFDAEECLSYLRDALSDAKCLREYEKSGLSPERVVELAKAERGEVSG